MPGRKQGAGGRPARGLRRFRGPRPPAAERCELCSVPLEEEHRHLVDVEQRVLACACLACAVLFDREGTGGGRFRTIPDRYLSDPGREVGAAGWQALGVPVGVAFFFRNSALDRMVALYPSPAGATESEIEPAAWQAAFGGTPLAATLAPDVEALVVRRDEEHTSCHLVPVDTAYELVGRLRLHWQGFDGGDRARAELDAFFAEVERKAMPVPQSAPAAPEGGGTP
ncbi:DUF5947 family protein [Actinacidiphila guanduensis]|uniref:DUF5947 family protein n=1 Tax=Actinacidiphila guanduensis TaxID=310781 RepID=UPI000B899E54|nr:DUF5947 family protein [Actinacidiphila guanduensis]